MSRPTAISPEEQEQVARQIGVLLLQAAPEDWQEITVEFRATGEYHDLLGEVGAKDGSSRGWEPPAELEGIFERLRDGMYRPDVGTWLSALYVVERPSSYRIDINFDSEPHWHNPLPRAAYVDELRRYPRSEENIPDWLRERLEGISAAPQDNTPGAVPESAGNDPAAPPEPPEQAGFHAAEVFDDYDEQDRPVVAGREPVPAEELDPLRQYLENAPIVLASRDDEQDQLDPERALSVPGTWHTDGTWLWQGAVAYYLAQYGVPPQGEFLEHVRERDFTLREVDDATRDAAVSELLDRPDSAGDPAGAVPVAPPLPEQPLGVAESGPAGLGIAEPPLTGMDQAEPFLDNAEPNEDAEFGATGPVPGSGAPDSGSPGIEQPEHAAAQESAGADRGVDPEPENVLGRLHDRFAEYRVDSTAYRVGSHNPDARCLLQEGPDWVVTGGPAGGGDVRFSRIDQAAAYLLGALLLDSPAAPAELAHDSEPSPAPIPTPGHDRQDNPAGAPAPAEESIAAVEPNLPPEPAFTGEPESFAEPGIAAEPGITPEPGLPDEPAIAGQPNLTADPGRATEPSPAEPALGSSDPAAAPPEQTGLGDLPGPAPSGGNPLFMANQDMDQPAGAPPEPPVPPDVPQGPPDVPQGHDEIDPAPQPPPSAPPSPPMGQPAQTPSPGPAPNGSAAPPPLPKRQPRTNNGESGPVPPAPPGAPGQQQRPSPGAPGMGGPPRQAPPPAGPPRRPGPEQGGRPPQQPAPGQQPGGQQGAQPGGQQIQPLNGEPPLTLYRDRRVVVLQPGTEVDRFGEPNGNVTYSSRTPYTQRSLPPQWSNRTYTAYRVQRPLQALRGTAVPWFEQPGGGTAFVLPTAISDLLMDGTLVELPAGERPPME